MTSPTYPPPSGPPGRRNLGYWFGTAVAVLLAVAMLLVLVGLLWRLALWATP